mgnify:CR=1 FL=1
MKNIRRFGDGSLLIEGVDENNRDTSVTLAAAQVKKIVEVFTTQGAGGFESLTLDHPNGDLVTKIATVGTRTKIGNLVWSRKELAKTLKFLAHKKKQKK